MKYKIELNEIQRNLLLKAATEMMTDKEFSERDLAGEIYLSLVYAEAENETGGKHFTEDQVIRYQINITQIGSYRTSFKVCFLSCFQHFMKPQFQLSGRLNGNKILDIITQIIELFIIPKNIK